MKRRHIHVALRWLDRCWYRLTCQFWHRYNTVVCRSLPPTWQDRDHLLLYAAFQILEDFVEKEEGHFFQDVFALYVADCGAARASEEEADWDNLRTLYAWWKVRKAEHCGDYGEDTAMLKRLVELRRYLWS